MSVSLNRPGVRREALAAVVRREIDRRGSLPWPANKGPYAGITHEIAASGLMRADTAQRVLWRILNEKGEVFALETADKILTALGISYLLHTELEDAIVEPACSNCGGLVGEVTPGCGHCRRRGYARQEAA